jgi:hypothetical protein
MIKSAIQWAKSLGYDVVEHHLGTKTGADAIFQNVKGQKLILEVVTGSRFKSLFSKARIKEALVKTSKFWVSPPEILGLIVVGDRIGSIRKHGVEAGLPNELFNPPTQTVFPVLARDFKEVIPVLLVSILGTRESAYDSISAGRKIYR